MTYFTTRAKKSKLGVQKEVIRCIFTFFFLFIYWDFNIHFSWDNYWGAKLLLAAATAALAPSMVEPSGFSMAAVVK